MTAPFLLLDCSAPVEEETATVPDDDEDGDDTADVSADDIASDAVEAANVAAAPSAEDEDESTMAEADDARPDDEEPADEDVGSRGAMAGSDPLAACCAGGVRMMPEMSALSAMLVVVSVMKTLVGGTVTLNVTL